MQGRKIVFKKGLLLVAILAVTLILSMTLSSCITIKINTVRGSGVMATQEFEVTGFSRLNYSGIGKIILSQGESESLKITAEKNILEAMDVKVSGNTLNIGLKKDYITFIPTREIIIYLDVVDLEEIYLSGAGLVECENLETENLSINSSGLGSVKMNLIAENLKVDLTGAGKVEIAGEVNTQEINISGLGSYEARDLESSDCKINISGAGKAAVNVMQTLDVVLSGLGSVEYKGSPSVTQNISGVGGTIKSID